MIRSRTGQPFLSDTVRSRRLSFGNLHRTDLSQDHYRALQACMVLLMIGDGGLAVPDNSGYEVRTVEADLRPMNLGLATSKRSAQVMAETHSNGYVYDKLLKKMMKNGLPWLTRPIARMTVCMPALVLRRIKFLQLVCCVRALRSAVL